MELREDALLYEDLVDAFYQVVEVDRNDAFYSLAQCDKAVDEFDRLQYRDLRIRERFASRKLWHALDLVAAIRKGDMMTDSIKEEVGDGKRSRIILGTVHDDRRNGQNGDGHGLSTRPNSTKKRKRPADLAPEQFR